MQNVQNYWYQDRVELPSGMCVHRAGKNGRENVKFRLWIIRVECWGLTGETG